LAQNLAIIRVATGWTQQALADAAQVSRATIAQLEAGLGDPRLSTIEQIARAVGVTPSVLLLGTPEVDELIKSHKPGGRPAFSVPPHIQEMLKLLIASGQLRHKLEAARIVLDLSDGVTATAQSVATALGAAHGGAPGAVAVAAIVEERSLTSISL
jgi:transcriptional regulator with XRE-family HTH domain